jgi:hypothetical protein
MAAAGYATARYFFEMLRPTLEEIQVPPLPDGLEIRPVVNDRANKKQLWDADVEAFEDHWGGFDSSDAAFEAWLVRPYWDADLWVVGWDGDEIAGAVMNTIYTDDNEAFARRRGWSTTFVRRAWRRRGLARSVRATVRLREAGMTRRCRRRQRQPVGAPRSTSGWSIGALRLSPPWTSDTGWKSRGALRVGPARFVRSATP